MPRFFFFFFFFSFFFFFFFLSGIHVFPYYLLDMMYSLSEAATLLILAGRTQAAQSSHIGVTAGEFVILSY